MKYSLLLLALLSVGSMSGCSIKAEPEPMQEPEEIIAMEEMPEPATIIITPDNEKIVSADDEEMVSPQNQKIRISVVGQGVAPMHTASPAQAYALAKRAALADAYRLIAEKVKGVRVDGQDLIKNMMVKRSTVRTSVNAMVKNATIVETSFKDGLCEVEMETVVSYDLFN